MLWRPENAASLVGEPPAGEPINRILVFPQPANAQDLPSAVFFEAL
jgi:hypothetical protein